MAGCLLIPVRMAAQTGPASTSTSASTSTGTGAGTIPSASTSTGAGIGVTLSPDAQAKLDKLETDLKTAQAKGDAKAAATILNQIGVLWFQAHNFQNATDAFNRAVDEAKLAQDTQQGVEALIGLGDAARVQGLVPQAEEAYKRALDFATAQGDLAGKAEALNGLALLAARQNQAQQALDYANQALAIWQSLGNRAGEAFILTEISAGYNRFGDEQKALDYAQQVLDLYKAAGDHAGEANALLGIGDIYSGHLDKKCIDEWTQALAIARQFNLPRVEAQALNKMGLAYSFLGDKQKALDSYNQALPIFRAVGDRSSAATMLNNIGSIYDGLGDKQKALDYYNQALEIHRVEGDRDGEAITLNNIGRVYSDLGDKQKALDDFNQALPIHRATGDRSGEATTLNNIGAVYDNLGEKQTALDDYNQALAIRRAIGDHNGEATTLNNIGLLYSNLGEPQKALDSYNEVLPIFRAEGDRRGEATILHNIGAVYDNLGEKQKALDCYNEALPILRAIGDRRGEANTLSNIGIIYWHLGEVQKALDYYNQALPIRREVGDRDGEAVTLNNIGSVYSNLGEKQKALDDQNQALEIYRAVGDRDGEANTLNNIGSTYEDLGEPQKALDNFNEALPVMRAVGDRHGEATILNNIGFIYDKLGDKQKALDYYNQVLTIMRAVGDRSDEAVALNNIALIYSRAGDKQKALDDLNQALTIRREVGDRDGEAVTMDNIGGIYDALGEKQKGLEYHSQALPLAAAVGDPLVEAAVLRSLLSNQKSDHPAEAIFFGKQAVNLLQQVRGNIQGLDKQLQSSFLATKTDYYHDLADLLITQNRLPEAQQVLDLLKQQEYSDYMRGAAADTLSPLTLTPAEEQAQQDYQKSTAQLVSLGEQWEELKKISARTPDQEKQFQQMSDQLDAASKGLSDYYDHLFVVFGGANSDAKKQVAEIKGDVRALKNAIADSPRTVALYTVVTGDHYRVIVITSSAVPVAREYAIAEEDLNRKVAAFDQALRDPHSDPRPLAQDLYNILVGPVKADLDQAHAETLVWSLDGALRYLPLAALYDGKNYLVEKYSTVTITPASFGQLSQKPDVSKLSVLAMGISRQYENNLPALPAVVGELDDVVKDPQVQAAHGVLPGTILLNGQFTEKAMEDALNGKYRVVHIASHFVFEPGDDSKSYLLLAGKDDASKDDAGKDNATGDYHLTVEDFSDNQNLDLSSTDLLTLSACQTGMSGDASNGREVDGLGMTAQYKGAKAVISSLWSVNDASTGELMSDFYKRWASGGGDVSKVEALRQAQVDLLLGKINGNGSASGRGFDVVETSAPVPAGFAHPYYWAPFVLMGNWQ
jgi:CHAT domain-containing protein/Tfp pilus assembly protein PilF